MILLALRALGTLYFLIGMYGIAFKFGIDLPLWESLFRVFGCSFGIWWLWNFKRLNN